MGCVVNESDILSGFTSADALERRDAVDKALSLNLDSLAVGAAAQTLVNSENDGTYGMAIINGALQIVGNVGAVHGGVNDFLLSVINNPPEITYQTESLEYTQPEYANPDDDFPIDPETGSMWDPNSGHDFPMPIYSSTNVTVVLDGPENKASIKAAAVGALETVNEQTTLSENTVDSVIDNLSTDVLSADEDDVYKLHGYAASVCKLCSRVSKKVDEARRKRMSDKLRNKFYYPGAKKLGCAASTYVADVVKDTGDDDTLGPDEQDIIDNMDNCGASTAAPMISLSCPPSRVVLGDSVDLSPTITNSLGNIVILYGEVIGDISQMSIIVDFGDGSSESAFSHTYSQAGQYNSSVTVIDSEYNYTSVASCIITVYKPVDVDVGPPTPSVIAPDDYYDIRICPSDTVLVTDLDVSVGTDCYTFNLPASETVLNFVDAYGDPANPPYYIVPIVVSNPLSVSIHTDGVQCTDTEKVFSLDILYPVGAVNITWTIDGVEYSGGEKYVYSYDEGEHIISATVEDGAGRIATTGDFQFIIYPRYDASITYTSVPSGVNVVPGLTINVDVCVTLCSEPDCIPIISVPDGREIATGTYVFPRAGTYTVTATICDFEISKDIIVYGAPEILLTKQFDPACEGLVKFTLEITSGRTPYTSFIIDVGDGTTYKPKNKISFDHQYKKPGDYMVYVTVIDSDDVKSVYREIIKVS